MPPKSISEMRRGGLGCWNRLFAFFLVVPADGGVGDAGYYAVLGRSDARADCTEFIEFMLEMIDAALEIHPPRRGERIYNSPNRKNIRIWGMARDSQSSGDRR